MYLCKMKKIALALAVMAFTACAMPKPGEVRLDKIYGVETLGTSLTQSKVVVRLGVVNDSRTRITLREADLHIFNAQGEILEALVDRPIYLPRRSTTQAEVPLTLRFKGGLGVITALSRLTQDAENLRVAGVVRLEVGAIGILREVKDEPLHDFLQSIGMNLEDVL